MEKTYDVLNELIPKTQELHRAIFDKGYEQGKRDALAQIRAEIEGKYRVILKSTPSDDWARKWNECVDEILEVIDTNTKKQTVIQTLTAQNIRKQSYNKKSTL